MNLSIIGYGHMAKALVQGLAHHPNYHVRVAAPSLEMQRLSPQLQTYHSNIDILPDAQILILAVKPAQMAAVLTEIQAYLRPDLLVISIAAGLSLAWFAQRLPSTTALIRAMPNIAASCSQSATPLVANTQVTPLQQERATSLFQSWGQVAWVNDDTVLDVCSTLSGSGPAYLFIFADAMCQAAIHLGLPATIAHAFTVQTLQGAAQLAGTSNQDLSGLAAKVTSKAGITAAALGVFSQHQLYDIVLDAMTAAFERSQTLHIKE